MNGVMARSDGPANLKILIKSQMGVDFGPCWQTVVFTATEADSWGPTMVLRSWGPTKV